MSSCNHNKLHDQLKYNLHCNCTNIVNNYRQKCIIITYLYVYILCIMNFNNIPIEVLLSESTVVLSM